VILHKITHCYVVSDCSIDLIDFSCLECGPHALKMLVLVAG
jgi:hypothetical protein